ncbi:hypothetical protein LCGC14_2135460, partial [marine sediment metagenome]
MRLKRSKKTVIENTMNGEPGQNKAGLYRRVIWEQNKQGNIIITKQRMWRIVLGELLTALILGMF